MNFFSTSSFFRAQRLGRWNWPWLILGLVISALALLPAVAICYLLYVTLAEFTELPSPNDLFEIGPATAPLLLSLQLLIVGISFWLPAIAGTLTQGRSIKSLVSPIQSFRWCLAGKSIILVSLIAIIFELTSNYFYPSLEFTGFSLEKALWFIPMLFCILIQTSGEDAFFKGYLLRQFGAVTLISWIAPIAVVIIFISGHLMNPDMRDDLWTGILTIVIGELVAIYLLMRSGRMEIPFVIHWLNNAKILLFIAEKETQSNNLTLWVYEGYENSESYENESIQNTADIESIIYSLIFYGLILLGFCWRRSPFFVPPMVEPVTADLPGLESSVKEEIPTDET